MIIWPHKKLLFRVLLLLLLLLLGFWMVSPRPGELEKIQAIVARQQERAKELPPPHFDYRTGWGHVIQPPDMWWTINKLHTRRAWKFVGSHAGGWLILSSFTLGFFSDSGEEGI